MRKLFTVLLVFLMSGVVWGQILTFEFSSLAGDELTAGSNYNDVAITVSTISRGAGLTASGNAGRFNATSWAELSIDNAISGDDYMEFTITPVDENEFIVSSIYLQLQRSSTGPRGIAIRSSIDNYASNLDQEYPIDDVTSTQNFTFTFDQGVFSSAVTYRIYMWAESTGGSGGIGDGSGNDLVVYGDIIEPEPTNHVTNFTATHNGATQVDLTWSDNDGAQAADGFLILINTTGTFADPVDGTPQADDTDLSDNAGQVNVAHGVETYSFTGLTPETQYFFKIYPYTNSGSAIDYKTDGTVPTANATPTALLLVENFDYVAGTLLTNNGWTAHSASGTNPIEVNNGGLTYTDYPSSGIGNAAILQASGEAVHRTFPVTNSGVVYVSFLINVTSTWTTSDYVFNLGNDPIGTGYRARLFLINGGIGDFEFGLSQSAAAADVQTSNGYSYLTTYLLVLKYEIIDGSSNDEVSLYVFDTGVPINEPVTPTLGPVTGSDISALGSVALRQTYANTQLIIDGIRVATSWSQAPLPVELTSFNAELIDNFVLLNWETATEVNNFGFDVERKYQVASSEYQNWEKIGFVEGNGTTNSPREYSFIDDNLPDVDNVSYRLKQIDIDGTFSYSKVVEVNLTEITGVEDDKQYTFALEQNYPNPFNPVTTINFTIPNVVDANFASTTNAKLIVYNMLGQQVSTLVNEIKPAGNYQVQFDGSNLPSGIYFYTLSYGEFLQTRKLVLLK